MGIADDMKNLTQDIAESYHARIRDIAALKKETAASLANGEAQRLNDFKAMNAEIKKAVAGVKKDTSKLLKDFDTTHAEMSAQLKDALAKGESQRLDDFKAMNAETKKAVAGIKKHTSKLLKDFDTTHAEMSAQLKTNLAENVKERMAEISKMLKDFQAEREKMAAEWQKLEEMLLRERSKEVSPKKKKAIEREEPAEHVKMVASAPVQ